MERRENEGEEGGKGQEKGKKVMGILELRTETIPAPGEVMRSPQEGMLLKAPPQSGHISWGVRGGGSQGQNLWKLLYA